MSSARVPRPRKPSKQVRGALADESFIASLRQRAKLREHILRELPGWGYWLAVTAERLHRMAAEEELFLTEPQVRENLDRFAAEWVDALGVDADDLFQPFLQQAPARYAASEEFRAAVSAAEFGQTPSLAKQDFGRKLDEHGAWPAPMLLGLLGASCLAKRRAKRGRQPAPRRARAVELVAEALGPYVDPKMLQPGAALPPPVVPPPIVPPLAQSMPPSELRTTPVSLALAALVALHLSAPREDDPTALSEGEIEITASIIDQAAREIGKRVRRLPAEPKPREWPWINLHRTSDQDLELGEAPEILEAAEREALASDLGNRSKI